MNVLVLSLAAIVGLGVAAVIWWFGRNLWFAAAAAISLIALVAIALPWDLAPANPTPRASERRATARTVPPELPRPTLAMLQSVRPIEVPADGYVGSESCRECHTNNHSSWNASYHRTMTQVASPDAVLGDFEGTSVSALGRDYRLQKHGDVCWVDMHDPALPVSPQTRVNAPIVMTTGSHHMQAYWYATGTGRVVGLLPIVHLIETNEWIPRAAAFLERPKDRLPEEVARWNLVCSQCHTTHRRERPRPGTGELWDTQVAEFGISCEACHGPGKGHIEYQRSLDLQDSAASDGQLDPIVNPADLSHVRSSQVCGQCHSVRSTIQDERIFREHGHGYRAGDDLTKTHFIWERGSEEMREFLREHGGEMDHEHAMNTVYYSDGVVRVTGREYNGLKDSACFTRGNMSCLSCHQMHKSDSDPRSLSQWADDQLNPTAYGDDACLQCHKQEDYATSHTHHQIDSHGSRCYNCHMPHTAYGLLKAVRNHTISIPDVSKDLSARRPNACNLCHLDKTLDWTAEHLQSWYGIDRPPLDDDQRAVAASLLWILKGDAAERALVAWHMGWADALTTSGSDWQLPFLSQLLSDDYLAVRFIARRAMKALPGFADFEFDALAPESTRALAIEQIQKRWQERFLSDQPNRPHLLIQNNQVQVDVATRLLSERDHTPIELAE